MTTKYKIEKTVRGKKNEFSCINLETGAVIGTRKSAADYNKCFIVIANKAVQIKHTQWNINRLESAFEYAVDTEDLKAQIFYKSALARERQLIARLKAGDFSGTDAEAPSVLSWHKAASAKPDLGDYWELLAVVTLL